MKCSLCKEEAIDSMDFESGNNAEIPVTINLCEKHLQEADKLGYRFEQKYANEILEMAFRKLEGL